MGELIQLDSQEVLLNLLSRGEPNDIHIGGTTIQFTGEIEFDSVELQERLNRANTSYREDVK